MRSNFLQTSMNAQQIMDVTPMQLAPILKAPIHVPANLDSLEMDSCALVHSIVTIIVDSVP